MITVLLWIYAAGVVVDFYDSRTRLKGKMRPRSAAVNALVWPLTVATVLYGKILK